MPYLQLDVPRQYAMERKKDLARKLGDTYATLMKTTPRRVTVAIRELPDGSLWRCNDGDPEPGALLMCDVRRGRPREWREKLASALLDLCVDDLELPRDRFAVEFTQHAGDEMFRSGEGWSEDWGDQDSVC